MWKRPWEFLSPVVLWKRTGDALQARDMLAVTKRLLEFLGSWTILSTFVSGIVNYFMTSPLLVQAVLVSTVLCAISWAGVGLVTIIRGKRQAISSCDPIERVRAEILDLASKTERTGWRPEYRGIIKGSLSDSFARELDEYLAEQSSDQAVVQFLTALAARIDGAILRQSRLQRAADGERWNDNEQTLHEAKAHLKSLIATIPEPIILNPATAFSRAMASLQMGSTPIRDWRVETKAGIRGLMSDSIVKDYDGKLRMSHPELAAKEYLRALLITLSHKDLRGTNPSQESP